MLRIYNFFIVFGISLISINFSSAQIPTYVLDAKNFSVGSENVPEDKLEFDILIYHTNFPTVFEFAGGQYFIMINPLIANGGTMTYSIIGSDLPANLQPRSPSMGTASSPSGTVLRLAVNVFPGAGNGYNMTGVNSPGVRIVRMKLLNTVSFNSTECFSLEWRNPPIVTFATKIFAYTGSVNNDITTTATHNLDMTGVIWSCLTPVELVSFNSTETRNNVLLNWSTAAEINNQGFDIERRLENEEWGKIGFVEGSGNTSSQKNYTYADRVLSSGKYNYRLKQIDYNGNYEYHYLQDIVEIGIPKVFSLSQNYPNPFNPSTKIEFDIPEDSHLKILLYDMSGREVAILLNERKPAGYYSIQFNAGNLSSGMYFYRLSTGSGFTAVKKMVLIK